MSAPAFQGYNMISTRPPRNLVLEAYEEACDLEASLWEQIGHLAPGRAGHDPQAWQAWLNAVQASADAAEALRATIPISGRQRRAFPA